MSYEGYVQVLCEDGHLNIYDCRDDDYGVDKLCEDIGCGKKQIFFNDVDDTNCDAYGRMEFELLIPAVTETCNLGHVHVTQEARYKIPKKK